MKFFAFSRLAVVALCLLCAAASAATANSADMEPLTAEQRAALKTLAEGVGLPHLQIPETFADMLDGKDSNNNNNMLGSCPLCDLNPVELIEYFGYPAESHSVVPADRTVTLNMERIPRPGAPAVLLQHGLLDSSATWIMNGPSKNNTNGMAGLAFALYDAGFDVWLGNNRGNTYSPCETSACWKFSVDEMAKFDLPAMVELVCNKTNSTSIGYVGHSQGTAQAFAGLSISQPLNDRINMFVALAPVAFVNHQKSPLISLLADFGVVKLFQIFGVKKFLAQNWFVKILAELVCGTIFSPFCSDLIFLLCGVNPTKGHNLDQKMLPTYVSHTPAGTSVQNMAWWSAHVTHSGFDSGTSDKGPAYNLTAIASPIAFFTGGHDALADPEDAEHLLSVLGSRVVYNHDEEEYNHLDFVWGIDANRVIYPLVADVLSQGAATSGRPVRGVAAEAAGAAMTM